MVGKTLNVALVNRLLPKCKNMASLAYAYNNTLGVEKLGFSTLYKKLRENGISTDFVRGSKMQKIRSTVLDRVMSGISIGRRLDNYIKPAIREYLGNKCVCCGGSRGLEIDHIDGNHNNSQIFNLQLLCGTCHNEKTLEQLYA